ncbi:MAG: hypothetical protein IKX84_07810 [Clostridia bacterium]|nr:hypothetical protein [Clostridia bacterium]
MSQTFPRTMVENISLPRMLMGTNWMLGWSHTSVSADHMIKNRYQAPSSFRAMAEAYLCWGIDAMMAPFGGHDALLTGLSEAEQALGRHIIKIDTPVIDVTDSPQARLDAEKVISQCASNGSEICLIHHSSAEKLVNKLKGTMDRLPDYLDMIRQHGMVPGLSAHMPELILYSDENGYDVQTYIQIYNCAGFLMQIEIEGVRAIIENAKKPVMTIKPMAAGRVSPYVGLSFSFATLRPCDMVTVGAHTPEEVDEDAEIALAAIERRYPDMQRRSTPSKTAALGGEIRQHFPG